MKFDVIVFDFDGVLVESVDVKTQAFAALYQPYGKDVVQRVIDWHLAHGGVSRYEKFRHFHRDFLGKDLGADEEQDLGQRFSRLVEDAVVASPWVPGARDFLDAWHSRVPLYVASGTPEDELVRIVKRRCMENYFRGVLGSPAKKAEILRHIALEEGSSYERMLMVGDAMTDYEGAQEVDVAFIGRVPAGKTNPFPVPVPVIETLEPLSFLCD